MAICFFIMACTQAQIDQNADQRDTIFSSSVTATDTISPTTIMPNDTFALVTETDSLPPVAEGYHWISYRCKANLTDTGGTRSFNLFIVNRIDSIIYINISASGMELLRLTFKPDTITYVNKLGYNYYKGNYMPIKHLSGGQIDFNMLQAIVNGDVDTLQDIKKFSFEYDDYQPVDSTQSFFRHFIWKDLNHVITLEGTIKKVRIDIPGPTRIKIPEKFEAIKPF